MEKNFKRWHIKKSEINKIAKPPFFHECEIWWCALGANIGFEQDGGGKDFLRPVIVFKKFNNEIFLAIPLTKTKKSTAYYFQFNIKKDDSSTAVLSQVRLMDARRLSHKLSNISVIDFEKLKKKFRAFFT